ncbi:hypothetical protein [Paenibacillus sp. N3.4]|uniref:hypothetical protein n=1 Tax=Paenibacillus sp. N3.4 TaxID=2603222 RepID=UPI0011CA9D4E|nr:hypothetical protein [Paenibacillus sp. N3.4]TXK80052.1 hypothetical protein FU659_18995 [Paenibacillus sp. N3.4]
MSSSEELKRKQEEARNEFYKSSSSYSQQKTSHRSNSSSNYGTNENQISKIIKYIGYIEILAGLLIGFILGNQATNFSWVVAITWWCSGFVAGMLFVGFPR